MTAAISRHERYTQSSCMQHVLCVLSIIDSVIVPFPSAVSTKTRGCLCIVKGAHPAHFHLVVCSRPLSVIKSEHQYMYLGDTAEQLWMCAP